MSAIRICFEIRGSDFGFFPLRLVGEHLGEGADLGVGQALRGAVGVFALGGVVIHQHQEPLAVPGLSLNGD
jgi:hypothetical protein